MTIAGYCEMLVDAANPSRTPTKPPTRLSVTASATNCRRTSRARAPTARRTPISRVRSVTDSSMMFMMPMPPTSSDTPAMLASSAVIVLARAIERFRQLLEGHFLEARDVADDRARDLRPHAAFRQRLPRLRRHREVVRHSQRDLVTRPQQIRDLLRYPCHVAGRLRRDRDVVQLRTFSSWCTVVNGTYTASNCSSPAAGATSQLVLVTTPTMRNGLIPHGDVLPHGISVVEQLLRRDAAEHDRPARCSAVRAP